MSLSLPALYAIIDVDKQEHPFAFTRKLLESGATLVQLRNKTLSDEAFSKICAKIITLKDEFPNVKIIINDSIEIAKVVAADGVHLGQNDCSAKIAREYLGQDAIIGLSNHNLSQIQSAPIHLLDYLAIGPVFESITKSGHATPLGLNSLREICRESKLPIVAIGGINQKNLAEVFEAGTNSVAVISDLANTKDMSEYVSFFNKSRKRI